MNRPIPSLDSTPLSDSDELARIRTYAQTNPVQQLTTNVGELVTETRRELELLTRSLRALDKARDVLAEHGVQVNIDLGPIGNAAAAARRDLERERPGPTFRMPDAS